jgi:prophage antirepressor-like protein
MNNQIQIFKNNDLNISLTSIQYKDEIYFIPSEAGEALGYSDLSDSIRKSDGIIENIDYKVFAGPELNDLKAMGGGSNTPFVSKNQNAFTLLTESGLNALILRSKKPFAKKIRIWVTSDVLPNIRRYGVYATPATIESMIADPRWAATLLIKLAEEREAKEKAMLERTWIGNKREATAMATASKYKRENIKLKKELGMFKDYASIKAVMIATKSKKEYSWKNLKTYSLEHGYPVLKTYDVNYGKVNVYHKVAWMDVYKINIQNLFK